MNSFSLVYFKMLALRDFNAFHIVAASIKAILLKRSWLYARCGRLQKM
jgi:hypothetical protein